MSFWSNLKEKHKWNVERRRKRRRTKWELFKKRLTCKHNFRVVSERKRIETTTNIWTGRNWVSDRYTSVTYKCDDCGKEKYRIRR